MTDTMAMSEAHGTHAAEPTAASDGHGHETTGEPLGPVDTRAWAVAIVGGAIGVLVALALFAAGQG